MVKTHHIRIALCLALLFAGTQAVAQVATPPQRSPRTPVSKQNLAIPAPPLTLPLSRTLEGRAQVLDSSLLRLDGFEVKLFGLVPPQIGAAYGPQARAVMDSLTAGDITCKIMDRERAGPFLATCQTHEGQADFGLELLRRGLAVAARGSLAGHPLETPYLAAETAAQNQKLGLWSLVVPAAASAQAIRQAATAQAEEPASTPATKSPALPPASVVLEKEESTTPPVAAKEEAKEEPKTEITPQTASVAVVETTAPSLLERYQIFATGLLALFGAFITILSVMAMKARQRKEDLRALAAALRGELMAARAICQARLSKIASEDNDRNTSWPRLRVMVFQAYVGRLGLLGAELSRQIASIYGMTSDYASFYGGDSRFDGPSKKQALETLVKHIEDVTPRLAQVEQSGTRPAFAPAPFLNTLSSQKPRALPLAPRERIAAKTHITLSDEGRQDDTTQPLGPSLQAVKVFQENLSKAKDELIMRARKAALPRRENAPPKPQETAQKPSPAVNLKAPIVEKLFQSKVKPTSDSADPFNVPDYANLTEEELESLLYEDEDYNWTSAAKSRTKAG